MYAVYNYKAGSTAANVTADIIKLLTGETNLANLSADCVTANSSIVSTVAAGWTVHDAAAGSGAQVIKALNQDATTYKYYKLNCTSTTVIQGLISEDWNATTHTATNSVNGSNTSYTGTTWSAASGGYFYIYATSKNIIMMSYHTGAYQNVGGIWLFEHTRDTVPTGYPAFCQTVSANPTAFTSYSTPQLAHPRYKKSAANGDAFGNNATNGAAFLNPLAPTGWPSGGLSAYHRDASEANNVVAYKLGIGLSDSGYNPGVGYRYYGECYDIYGVGVSLGAARDEIAFGGKTYVLHLAGNSMWLLVPKE